MLRLLLFSVLFSLAQFGFAQGQTRTKKKVEKKFYANGHLKSVTITRTTLPKYIDPMNFYRKIKVKITEYDSVSTLKTKELTRITKVGNDGRPCYEIYFEEILYDSYGKRASYTMSKCDKKKAIFKEYRNGDVVFIRINKRRKRQ